jgi:hypothetical protein
MVHVEFARITALFNTTDEPPLLAVKTAESPQPESDEETGLSRTILDGSESVSDAWVSAVLRSLFLILIVSCVVCPINIVVGEKLLFTEGDRMPPTRKVALAGVVLVMAPPSLEEVNAPAGIVLIRFPGVVEVTSTDTVHEPGVDPTWAGTVPPLKDKVVPPGTAVTEPPHELDTLTGFAMSIPGWTLFKLSVQRAFVNGNPLGLNIFTSRRDIPPGGILSGAKLLFISAGKDNP